MKKIQIVEDEVAIAMDLEMNLEMLGYKVSGHAVSYDEAISLYKADKPDLVLMDINLYGEKTGIDVANWINKNGNTPVIFLTAFNDNTTVNTAINSEPYGYIVKNEQFSKLEIQDVNQFADLDMGSHNVSIGERDHAIEIVKAPLDQNYSIISFGAVGNTEWSQANDEKFLFVKDKSEFHRILFSDIIALEALDNYTKIHTSKHKYTILGYLSEFEEKLDDTFVRVHRSHIAALKKIEKIDGYSAVCGDLVLPISRTKKDGLIELLKK